MQREGATSTKNKDVMGGGAETGVGTTPSLINKRNKTKFFFFFKQLFKTISPNSRIDVLASVGFVCFGCLFRHYCVSMQCCCSLRRSFVCVLVSWTSKNTH